MTRKAEQPDRPRFQILALDGGGVRGIFTAALLARLEEDTGRPVIGAFDLIVGTSTGGIIALGLGAGLSPREILDFYVDERLHIFPNRGGFGRLRNLFVARYKASGLEDAVKRVFGTQLLGESRIPLVIPSYDLGENDVHLFKTPHHERLKRDYKIPMWAVAMATSAAPTFFPAFQLPGDHTRLIDGGVWANNPAMVGVTEAVGMFGRSPTEVRVLSLGTTSTMTPRRRGLDNAGLLAWARRTSVVDVFLHGQSAGAFAQVQHLVGRSNAYRLDPPAPAELASLDACDAEALIAKAGHHSREFCPTFEQFFGTHTPHPYTPLHCSTEKEGAHAHD